MRILFIKLSSIGDVVHTLPTLSAVKSKLPDARVSWVVERSAAEILRKNELIDELIEIDTRSIRKPLDILKNIGEARQRFGALRQDKYEIAIDFQGLLKSGVISRLSRTQVRTGFAKDALREKAAGRFYQRSFDVRLTTNVIRKNIELAERALGDVLGDDDFTLAAEPIDFPISTDTEHKEEAQEAIRNVGEQFVILNPAGGWPTKLWPAQNYGKLADQVFNSYGLRSMVSVGPGEEELAETVIGASESGAAKIVNLSIKGFYETAKLAKCYVGGDTAPTHLATAAECPVIGIFGPTEWWRNGSIRENDVVVERNDIDCRENCHRRSCDNWICMDIKPDIVRLAIERRLGL